MPPDKTPLLEIIKNESLSWVKRGGAIDELSSLGMLQKEIAKLTGLAPTTIGQQRKCFLHLTGAARRMCEAREINADACSTLALAASKDSSLSQDSVIKRAVEICKTRNSGQPQRIGRYGKPSLSGHITNDDMRRALSDEKRTVTK